ncbi:hypothetical protein QAD02_007610 [Eretmocerus hayati]|uniref:Uncharacterized protein n=1 Tax=Eretmocerus hayati TaxID=131215 RepID=A0ACC2N463_9HYME|nr:hypothetical protein QAD02_007610 [Eretmocerus hayati]
MHQLIYSFIQDRDRNGIGNTVPLLDRFLTYLDSKLSRESCQEAEFETRKRSDCPLWYELRYGRLTGSKLHESLRCKTSEGSLLDLILEATKISDTFYMARGRNSESEVLSEVGKIHKITIKKVGFLLIPSWPIVGASLDQISDEFIVECPAKTEFVEKCVEKGEIISKFKAQMMLQMLAAGEKEGLFCVADVDFERNKKVNIIELAYDEDLINAIIAEAVAFWEEDIFPPLYQAALSTC